MNGNRIYWDFVVILLAVYTSLAVPMEIAFRPPWLLSNVFYIFNSAVDFIYAIDIIICFRTTY